MINRNIPIASILDEIISNYSEIIQHTGNTWKKRLLRPFWEFYRTIMAMFVEAPLLSMLIIGLPSSILSMFVIVYVVYLMKHRWMKETYPSMMMMLMMNKKQRLRKKMID